MRRLPRLLTEFKLIRGQRLRLRPSLAWHYNYLAFPALKVPASSSAELSAIDSRR